MDKHPDKTTPQRLLLIYAWNETGEGGYFAPDCQRRHQVPQGGAAGYCGGTVRAAVRLARPGPLVVLKSSCEPAPEPI
jgi:hypothetical protein